MVTIVPIGQAKIVLPQLVKRAAAGETIFISAFGHPTAKLVSVNDTTPFKKKIIGAMKGEFEVPEDFDAPLPDDICDSFGGAT